MPLGIGGTFNFMLVFQAEHNILMLPFPFFGVAGVFGGSLASNSTKVCWTLTDLENSFICQVTCSKDSTWR
jgi:Photosynthetic reaction centre protein